MQHFRNGTEQQIKYFAYKLVFVYASFQKPFMAFNWKCINAEVILYLQNTPTIMPRSCNSMVINFNCKLQTLLDKVTPVQSKKNKSKKKN